MRHRKKKFHLGRDRDHRHALVRNLATSLILYEKIKTTRAKAKVVQPVIDKIITIAKKDNTAVAVRKLQRIFFDENASKKTLEELKKRYSDRTSGFTRIIPVKARATDAAPLVQIELV